MYHGNIQTGKTGGPSLYSNYATWDDYDGAVNAADEQRVIGMGRSQADAIKDLIESTSALDEGDARIDEYAEYLRSKAEAEDVMMEIEEIMTLLTTHENHHEGDLFARKHPVEYVQYVQSLTSIGGDADFEGSAITELPALTSIGGWAYFRGPEISILGRVWSHEVIDGMSMLGVKWKRGETDGVQIGSARYFTGDVKNPPRCWLARIGEHTAHGETVEQAVEDVRMKALGPIDEDLIRTTALDVLRTKVVTMIQWHVLSGRACRAGTASVLGCSVADLPPHLPLDDAYSKSAGHSYGETFRNNLDKAAQS